MGVRFGAIQTDRDARETGIGDSRGGHAVHQRAVGRERHAEAGGDAVLGDVEQVGAKQRLAT
jgi:hypothetical protein